jgi:NAD(P)-dependent dehydrogenase (short-subunit alcohol dehydrogenase family)
MLSVNESGLIACFQAAGRIMRRAGYGKIVNVASIASEIGTPTIASYAATKGAVRQLTKSLAVEWACDGIRVNAILPGWFRTEMTEASFQNPAWVEKIMRRIPLRREGVPADIEGTFLFLASPMSDYLTGAMIPVDGGALAS